MKVFISYRRTDTEAMAGRIEQFLERIPAVDDVFLDVSDIGVGENFQHEIDRTLADATHVFALIGSQWEGRSGASNRARILDPEDIVRREIRVALDSKREGKVKVVPILIDRARMPSSRELPDELKELPKLNAFALRTGQFEQDMASLLDHLLGHRKGRGSRWRQPRLTSTGIALRALGGLTLSSVGLLTTGLANRYLSQDCYDLTCMLKRSFSIDSDADALGLLSALVIAVLMVGAFAPFLPRLLRRRQ